MNDIEGILVLAGHTHDEARQSLVDGFALDSVFDNYMLDDLSIIQLRIALKGTVGEKEGRRI